MSKKLGINQDTAAMRGVRSGIHAAIGVVVGLFVAVWGVPGVPDVVFGYLQNHVIQLAVVVGVPSGLAGFLWNVFRKDVKNY